MTLPTGEPSVEQIQSLAAETSTAFGLDPDQQMDQGLAETTVMLLTMGAASAAGGSTYTAAGFFRSPDKTDRPIMALINCFYLETERQSVHTAIAGLEEIHRHSGACSTIVDLPAGRAVITHTRETNPLLLNDGSVDVVQHASTAWIPNLAGAGVASVAVTSNNTEDWSHVADMATGVFETFERGGD
ncbi:MAG: hypothetical protein ACRDQ7_00595 [Haloechinothrix sp.]